MSELASRRLPRGLSAGVAGTLALTAWEPLRDSRLGHPPPYSVRNLARRAARTWLGVRLRPPEAQRWGLVLRWLYGPSLGTLHVWLHVWLRPVLPGSALLRGLLLGGGVWLFECISFPLLRVTPPLRAWSNAERRWLALQCLLFGLVTEAMLSGKQVGGLMSGRPPPEEGHAVAPGPPLSPP